MTKSNELPADNHTASEAETILQELASVFFPARAVTGAKRHPDHRSDAELPDEPDAELRYQALVEQIPAVIFLAYLDEAIGKVYVSPHIETALGFTQQEWINDPIRWYNQIHPEDRGKWNLEAAQLLLTGEPLRAVYRVIARDGHVVSFHCQATMVRRQDGQPWFIHGVGFDITDLKQAEEALRGAHAELEARVQQRTAELARANAELRSEIAERKRAETELALRAEELARVNADLQQFAYSASHDLQEPIRNVAIYSQILARRYRGALDSDADQILGVIIEGATRLGALINDLLSFTRLSAPTTEPMEVIDANLVLASVLEILREAVTENNAAVTHDLLPKVRIPAAHLQLVLQNLVLNALKYRRQEPPRIHISSTPVEDLQRFSVQDNGIGIAAQYHEKIFGIFKRLHTREESAGTGMGLAICRRTIERYGGRIWVLSEPDNGATFFFTVRGDTS